MFSLSGFLLSLLVLGLAAGLVLFLLGIFGIKEGWRAICCACGVVILLLITAWTGVNVSLGHPIPFTQIKDGGYEVIKQIPHKMAILRQNGEERLVSEVEIREEAKIIYKVDNLVIYPDKWSLDAEQTQTP